MRVSNMVSIGVATFIGGMTGYLSSVFAAGPPAPLTWKWILICALLAGISAVAHLYQNPNPPKPPPTEGGVP